MRKAMLVVVLLAVALAAPLRAANNYGDVDIAVVAEPQGQNSHGYSEYLFHVANKGDKPHIVALVLPETHHGGNGSFSAVSRSVEVAAKRTATLSLLYPARPMMQGGDVRVFIDGQRMMTPIRLSLISGTGHHMHGGGMRRGRAFMPAKMAVTGVGDTLVLHAQTMAEEFFRHEVVPDPQEAVPGGPGGLPPAPGGVGGPPGAGGVGAPAGPMIVQALNTTLIRSSVPVSAWSDNWLAYTRYDAVIVTPKDLNELAISSDYTKRVLRAIWRYSEAGGVLVVVGGKKPPLPKAWDRPAHWRATWSVYQVGFGQCWHHEVANSSKWKQDDWSALQGGINSTNTPWQSSRSLRMLHESFPVVDDLGVPVAGLFALMLIFAIVIGPVNLIVLSRYRRRMWMLWTVPLISAITCLAVFGYMILAEGWSGHARIGGVTFLDQIEERATTLGRTAYYSPLTPGDGLRFSEDLEVTAVGGDHPTDESTCTLRWTGTQHLERGWVTARVPAYFALRRSETQAKPRLSIHWDADGRLVVVNALSVDVQSLMLADAKGQLYKTSTIPAGQEVVLDPIAGGKVGPTPKEDWRKIYQFVDWGVNNHKVHIQPESILATNTYVAIVDQTPFLESGLRSATLRRAPSVVIGVFGEIGKK